MALSGRGASGRCAPPPSRGLRHRRTQTRLSRRRALSHAAGSAHLRSARPDAAIDGYALAPETYDRPGSYAYTRDVPAELLNRESAKVDFQLDKVMPPAPPDLRELGILVLSVGLNAR